MSIKKLIFFQIDANNATNCAYYTAENKVIEKGFVKRESPVQNWEHQESRTREQKPNQKSV